MRTRLLLIVACLASAAVLSTQGVDAFGRAALVGRSVSASIVTDANAYNAVSQPSACSNPASLGGTCSTSFRITNKGTAPQTYTIAKETGSGNPDDVLSFSPSTTSEVAVGGTTDISVTLAPCGCSGARHTYFTIVGANAGVLDSTQTTWDFAYTYT